MKNHPKSPYKLLHDDQTMHEQRIDDEIKKLENRRNHQTSMYAAAHKMLPCLIECLARNHLIIEKTEVSGCILHIHAHSDGKFKFEHTNHSVSISISYITEKLEPKAKKLADTIKSATGADTSVNQFSLESPSKTDDKIQPVIIDIALTKT